MPDISEEADLSSWKTCRGWLERGDRPRTDAARSGGAGRTVGTSDARLEQGDPRSWEPRFRDTRPSRSAATGRLEARVRRHACPHQRPAATDAGGRGPRQVITPASPLKSLPAVSFAGLRSLARVSVAQEHSKNQAKKSTITRPRRRRASVAGTSRRQTATSRSCQSGTKPGNRPGSSR